MRSKEEIAELVRKHLAQHAANGLRFTVNSNEVQFGNDWYRIPAHPSYMPKRLFGLYEVMVEAMESISDEENLNVIIMTGEPEKYVDDSSARGETELQDEKPFATAGV